MGKVSKSIYLMFFLWVISFAALGIDKFHDVWIEIMVNHLIFVIFGPVVIAPILVNLWDYISKSLEDSRNIVWLIIKNIVNGIGWLFLALCLFGFIIYLFAELVGVSEVSLGIVLTIGVAIWGVGTIKKAIEEKDSIQ